MDASRAGWAEHRRSPTAGSHGVHIWAISENNSKLTLLIKQKGVDLRIGLDIARLSLKEMVDIIVIATGDSDLVPAFKFARREGVRIYLDHLGLNVRREIKAHADIVL